MMRDPNEYSIVCRRTLVDGENLFEARVLELPDVTAYAASREQAELEVLEAIQGLQKLAREMGHAFPAPASVPADFSGRVTLRMARSQHQKAALFAEAEGVSLNSFICEAVTVRLAMRSFESPHAIQEPASGATNSAAGTAPPLVAGQTNVAAGSTETSELRVVH